MKISCNRDMLSGAFGLAAAAASGKIVEVLGNVRMDVDAKAGVATLTGTDTEVGVRVEIRGVECEDDLSILLPVPPMSQILRDAEGDSIEIEDTGVANIIRTANAEFNLPSANAQTFPAGKLKEPSAWRLISGKLFSDIVSRTSGAIEVNSSKYAMGGVCFEFEGDTITAVATDGRRMSVQTGLSSLVGEMPDWQPVVVPVRPLQMLAKSISDSDEIEIAVSGSEMLARTSRLTLWCRLIEGRFPAWRRFFPKLDGFERVEISPSQMLSSIKQASIVADIESRGINFEMSPGRLKLSAQTAMKGASKIEMPILYSGKPITVKLDYKFVSEFVRTVRDNGELTMNFATSTSPVVMLTGDGATCVFMPMVDK